MTDWLNLQNKTIIVTGGASGIGSHIVQEMKQNGANVVVADLNVETREEDGLYNIQTDITSVESIYNMVNLVEERYEVIHALVNNAGINLPRLLVDVYSNEEQYEIDENAFEKMTNVNQKGEIRTDWEGSNFPFFFPVIF